MVDYQCMYLIPKSLYQSFLTMGDSNLKENLQTYTAKQVNNLEVNDGGKVVVRQDEIAKTVNQKVASKETDDNLTESILIPEEVDKSDNEYDGFPSVEKMNALRRHHGDEMPDESENEKETQTEGIEQRTQEVQVQPEGQDVGVQVGSFPSIRDAQTETYNQSKVDAFTETVNDAQEENVGKKSTVRGISKKPITKKPMTKKALKARVVKMKPQTAQKMHVEQIPPPPPQKMNVDKDQILQIPPPLVHDKVTRKKSDLDDEKRTKLLERKERERQKKDKILTTPYYRTRSVTRSNKDDVLWLDMNDKSKGLKPLGKSPKKVDNEREDRLTQRKEREREKRERAGNYDNDEALWLDMTEQQKAKKNVPNKQKGKKKEQENKPKRQLKRNLPKDVTVALAKSIEPAQKLRVV